MSTLKVNNLQTASGGSNSTPQQIEQGRCKAWVNFNGTGTVAIRDSYNVSSISDGGTGQYTVNFSTSMSNANFVVTWGGNGGTGSLSDGCNIGNLATGSFFAHWGNGGSQHDFDECFHAVFADGA